MSNTDHHFQYFKQVLTIIFSLTFSTSGECSYLQLHFDEQVGGKVKKAMRRFLKLLYLHECRSFHSRNMILTEELSTDQVDVCC